MDRASSIIGGGEVSSDVAGYGQSGYGGYQQNNVYESYSYQQSATGMSYQPQREIPMEARP